MWQEASSRQTKLKTRLTVTCNEQKNNYSCRRKRYKIAWNGNDWVKMLLKLNVFRLCWWDRIQTQYRVSQTFRPVWILTNEGHSSQSVCCCYKNKLMFLVTVTERRWTRSQVQLVNNRLMRVIKWICVPWLRGQSAPVSFTWITNQTAAKTHADMEVCGGNV